MIIKKNGLTFYIGLVNLIVIYLIGVQKSYFSDHNSLAFLAEKYSNLENSNVQRIFITLSGNLIGADYTSYTITFFFFISLFMLYKNDKYLGMACTIALVINPLLWGLVGTVNRQGITVIILLILLKRVKIFYVLLMYFVHPLSALLNSIFYIGITKSKKIYYIILAISIFLFIYFETIYQKFYIYSLLFKEINYYKFSTILLFTFASAFFYIKDKSNIKLITLLFWILILMFVKFQYIERLWLIPMLMTSIEIVKILNMKTRLILTFTSPIIMTIL